MSSRLEAASHFTATLWKQEIYAQLTNEVDPFMQVEHFRPRHRGFAGQTDFWETPSPEPQLPATLIHRLETPLAIENRLIEAARQLAAQIANRYQSTQILFIAVLRAGVPVADWLTKLLPGSMAVATSLFMGYGIDRVSLAEIRSHYPDRPIVFIDGWTGKGGVAGELKKLDVGPLAVLCDPWCVADFRGTTDDVLSPSAFFTGPTTLGFSRTFTRHVDQCFAAFKFPQHYLAPNIVAAWQNVRWSPLSSEWRVCLPLDESQESVVQSPCRPVVDQHSSFSTPMRVHSNEVCRALINSNPGEIFFLDDRTEARVRYDLLLEMADHQRVPTRFNYRELKALNARVACTLRLQS
jgi:Phosphoribosyl transferase (PRTase)